MGTEVERMRVVGKRRTGPAPLPLSVGERSATNAYPLHNVLCGSPAQGTGGYITERDATGMATTGGGRWFAGVSWSNEPEHGPYPSFKAAAQAVTGKTQVLSATLRAAGWTS